MTLTTLTIIVDDNLVVVNGTTYTTDCSSLAGIHAIQWANGSGTIEYSLINGVKQPPVTFTDITPYQAIITAATTPPTPPPPTPPTQAQLIAYAKTKTVRIEGGGITVNIGTTNAPENVECATDNATYLRLMAANSIAQANPSQTQAYPFPSGVITLTAAQIETIFQAITTFYASVTTQLAAVINAITAGTITTMAQVDTPPSPIPAWPANS